MKNKYLFLLLLLLITSCNKAENGQNLTIDPMVTVATNKIDTLINLTVNSDSNWTLTHYDSNNVPSWFEISPLSGQAGTSTVVIKVLEENNTGLERVSFISFKTPAITKTVTVKQVVIPTPPVPEEETPPAEPAEEEIL